MSTIRTALLSLPFVEEKRDGTLDLWAAQAATDPNSAVATSRANAALLFHVMRAMEAPFLFAHVVAAMRDSGFKHPDVALDFARELAQAVAAASPRSCPLLTTVSHLKFTGQPHADMLKLPQVQAGEDGRPQLWPARGDQPYSEQNSAGRYYGTCVARYIRQTGDLEVLARITQAMIDASAAPQAAENDGFSVGFATALAEIAIASDETSTLYQAAMLPIFEESSSEFV